MVSADPTAHLQVKVLRSGSAGNAILIRGGRTAILVDAGLPLETLARELAAEDLAIADLTAVLLTHEHDDHARGAGAVGRAAGVPVLGNEATLRGAVGFLGAAETDSFTTGQPFRIGDLVIESFPVPHDAREPVGFTVRLNGSRVVAACDLGDVRGPVLEQVVGADLVLLEANYDLRLLGVSGYPWFLKNRIISGLGHLSNEGAAEVALWAGRDGVRKTVVLLHLSEVNNLTPLARDTVRWALEREGIETVRVEAVRPNASGGRFIVAAS